MNSLDLIFQRVPTKIRGCGCQSSLGKGGGGGGQVWIKNGTSHNYGTPVMSVSAYHLYGKPGNSRENSNGTVHLSRYYLFPLLTETTEILCTICLDYQCQASC